MLSKRSMAFCFLATIGVFYIADWITGALNLYASLVREGVQEYASFGAIMTYSASPFRTWGGPPWSPIVVPFASALALALVFALSQKSRQFRSACFVSLAALLYVLIALAGNFGSEEGRIYIYSILFRSQADIWLTYFGMMIATRYIGTLGPGPAANPAPSRRRGYTLVELLIVIAIIAVLAALLIPVLSSARKSAYRTTDISNMKQLYAALAIYEQDYDGEMPRSIVLLVPVYAPKEIFASRADRRPNMDQYPADLYLNLPGESSELVPYRVSYAYLRAFETRFDDPNSPYYNPLISWNRLRQNPNVGVLACAMHMRLEGAPDRPMTLHGPWVNAGMLLRIRMDGSLHSRPRGRWGISVGGSWEELFYYDYPW